MSYKKILLTDTIVSLSLSWCKMNTFGFFIHILNANIYLVLQTLKLNPDIFIRVSNNSIYSYDISLIALISGICLLLGQSIILFINRIKPKQFVLIISINAFFYLIDLCIWAIFIWVIAKLMLRINLPIFPLIRITFLGCIPFLFSIFILVPYFGTFISRLLRVWSFIVVLFGIIHAFEINILSSLVIVGIGWICILAFNQTCNRPFLTFKNIFGKQKTLQNLLTNLDKI